MTSHRIPVRAGAAHLHMAGRENIACKCAFLCACGLEDSSRASSSQRSAARWQNARSRRRAGANAELRPS